MKTTFQEKELPDSILFQAVVRDDTNVIESVLNKGMDINIANIHGQTAIHIAVYQDKINVLKYLLNRGADINIQDNKGQTVIHIASLLRRVEIIKILLEHKIDINTKDKQGNTALDIATKDGNEVIMNMLVVYEARTSTIPRIFESGRYQINSRSRSLPSIYAKITRKKTKLTEEDIRSREEIKTIHNIVVSNTKELTLLLHEAIQENNECLAEFYINLGANFNKRINNTAPLEIAVKQKNINIIKLLLKQEKLGISSHLRRWANLLPQNENYKEIIELLKERMEEIKVNNKSFKMVYQVEAVNQEILPIPTSNYNKPSSCILG